MKIKKQKGAAVLEFVVVLPLLLLLVIGTIELGTAFFRYNTLTKSVRDGARYLAEKSTLGSTQTVVITDGLKADVKNLVVYGSTGGGGTAVLPNFTISDVSVDDDGASNVRVTAAYNHQLILGGLLNGIMQLWGGSFSTAIPLSATTLMRAT